MTDERNWVNVDDPEDPDLDDPATLGCLLALVLEALVAALETAP